MKRIVEPINSIKHEYANLGSRTLHISELDPLTQRGAICPFTCVSCGGAMGTRLGNHNAWHFYHLQSNDEVGCNAQRANESALHKISKEIIAAATELQYPAYYLEGKEDPDYNSCDYNQCKPFECFPAGRIKYSEAALESIQEGFTPDIILYSSEKTVLCIEIAVTHFVSDEKKKRIKERNLSTLEIDVSSVYNSDKLDREELKKILLDGVDKKVWIHNVKWGEYLERLKDRNRHFNEYFLREARKGSKGGLDRNASSQNYDDTECFSKKNRHSIDKAKDEKSVDEIFEQCHFYKEAVDLFGGIPWFCNISIENETVFRCDRRVWQILLFDKKIYGAQGTCFALVDAIYHLSDLISSRDERKVQKVIADYLKCLIQLGFVELNSTQKWEAYFVSQGNLQVKNM